MVERVWSGIDAAHAPDEDEADRFAAAELAAVRAGERLLVTRNGEPVAEIRPVAPGRATFIPRGQVARMATAAVRIDRHQFRADLDRAIDQDVT